MKYRKEVITLEAGHEQDYRANQRDYPVRLPAHRQRMDAACTPCYSGWGDDALDTIVEAFTYGFALSTRYQKNNKKAPVKRQGRT